MRTRRIGEIWWLRDTSPPRNRSTIREQSGRMTDRISRAHYNHKKSTSVEPYPDMLILFHSPGKAPNKHPSLRTHSDETHRSRKFNEEDLVLWRRRKPDQPMQSWRYGNRAEIREARAKRSENEEYMTWAGSGQFRRNETSILPSVAESYGDSIVPAELPSAPISSVYSGDISDFSPSPANWRLIFASTFNLWTDIHCSLNWIRFPIGIFKCYEETIKSLNVFSRISEKMYFSRWESQNVLE